ncbi:hypothetical protein MAR_025687, partial [Mya arenaria]
MFSIANLLDIGFSVERCSRDTHAPNNYGYRLIDLCKSANLYIANGRLGKDIDIGQCTCISSTLIDYVLLSPELFPRTVHFEVQEHDPLFSDVHSCVEFSINMSLNLSSDHVKNVVDSTDDVVKIPIWDNNAKNQFMIDSLSISKQYTVAVVNHLTNSVSNILTNAADKSQLLLEKKIVNKTPVRKHFKKEWYDNDCKVARANYIQTYNSKSYKKLMNKKINTFKENRKKNLRNSDPKAFWGLLNKYCDEKKKTLSSISKDVFYEHFV